MTFKNRLYTTGGMTLEQVGWAKPNRTTVAETLVPWFFLPLDSDDPHEPMNDWEPIYMAREGTEQELKIWGTNS